ncbi:MAG: DUF2905 domain-containing protein [Anaerolineae bacterium]|nr:DUF2905 domain-containing protein [Anaerolineae bacterium]
MNGLEDLGKMLLALGGGILLLGGALWLAGKVGLGRLPGDIIIRREGFSCYFPLATGLVLSIVLSVVLTVVVNLITRWLNR